MKPKKLLIAKPRGFCAGVERAVEIVETALELYGAPIYVRKEIVHNARVLEGFRKRGVVFVSEIDEIPCSAVAIISAHGVAPAVYRHAVMRNLRVIDATCPLVTKVHLEAVRFFRHGYAVVLIGHRGHDEVIGTLGMLPGQIPLVTSVEEAMRLDLPQTAPVAVITQTTLSVSDTRHIISALRRRFPALVTPRKEDICYATHNRQAAVRELARRTQLVLVVGSSNSSNSNRLKEVAMELGVAAHLIEHAGLIREDWVEPADSIGLTAGASTPESLVDEVIACFRQRWSARVLEIETAKEAVVFAPPIELYRLRIAG